VKTWVRIAVFVGLTLLLWYLVVNFTKSLTRGGPASAPAPAPAAPAPAAPGQSQ
jgi:hypothetical protein